MELLYRVRSRNFIRILINEKIDFLTLSSLMCAFRTRQVGLVNIRTFVLFVYSVSFAVCNL